LTGPQGEGLKDDIANLFRGLTRAYGTYTLPKGTKTNGAKVTGKALTIQGEVTQALWDAHLNGKKGLGIVPINDNNACWFGAIDIDVYPLNLEEVEARVAEQGLPLLPTRTKSGGCHLHAFGKEPLPAALLQQRLKAWAVALGYPANIEIFPKQAALKSAEDTGNWINMPYFACRAGKTERYGIYKGKQLTLDEYCTRAAQIAITAEQLESLVPLASADWFHDGPPCLQAMNEQGFTEATVGAGPHNQTLFAIGVYLKKRYGDQWQTYLPQYNSQLLQPPLDAGELKTLTRSLTNKDYNYQCKEQPCAKFCNREVCLTRRYGVAEAEPWKAPHDFLHERTAIAFGAEDVPSCIGEYALSWARAAGFDPTGVIASCVVTAAATLHDAIHLSVQPGTEWYESARLWIAIIGPPGIAKTPMIRAGVTPLQKLHREMVDAYATNELQREAEKKKDDDEREPLPALFTNDATIEKLSEVLADNEGGILYLAEELDSWLGSHDAYRSSSGARDRGEWLTLFDGGPHQVDRVKRGSFFVRNWGVSFLSATTPAALQKLIHKLPNDGLLQRILPFIIAHPLAPDTTADTAVRVQKAAERYDRVIRSVHQLSIHNGPWAKGSNDVPATLNADARALLEQEIARYRELAPACAVISPGLAGHVQKYGTMLARLTLTFHAVECVSQEKPSHPTVTPVSLATVNLAMRFLRKAFLHSRAFYGMLSGADEALDIARRVGVALVADGLVGVNRSELVQKYKIFRDADEGKRGEAMQLLVDFNWCRVIPGKYQKGYPTTWDINPAVHERFRAEGDAWIRRRALVKEAILANTGGA
jgi:hypothetical protein